MPAGPSLAAELVHTAVSVVSAPRKTRSVLLDVILSQGWATGTEAEDKADLWLPRFKRRLRFTIEQSVEEGQYRSFAFNSSGDDYIQGYCFAEPGDPPEIIEAKGKRANTLHIHQHVAGITPAAFESLSGGVLKLLGVKEPKVSRRSADQGVDFYGRVHFGDIVKPALLDAGAEKHFYVWLVGQSKHYPESRVSTHEIRELVGSVQLARAKVFAGTTDPLEDLAAKVCDPVFYLFFTSGRFTRDSKDILSRSGVLSFNGLQIAQFLADHGVGLSGGAFDPRAFDAWLSS
jgi:hypothetical protein